MAMERERERETEAETDSRKRALEKRTQTLRSRSPKTNVSNFMLDFVAQPIVSINKYESSSALIPL